MKRKIEFHVKHSAHAEMLRTFAELVRDRAVPLGLVAEGDAGRIWDRHVLDSVRAADLIEEGDRLAYDIGSGAGLPGIPLAIVRPWVRFILAEPRARAVGFLELAVERLGLANATPIHRRVEELQDGADLATARAFGSAEVSWKAAHPLLRPGGRLLYFAGRGAGRIAPSEPEPPRAVRVLEDDDPIAIMTRG